MPGALRTCRVQEHVVGNHRRSDQGKTGHKSAVFRDARNAACEQGAEIRSHDDHGHHEDERHDDDADTEEFLEVLDRIAREIEDEQNAEAPDRCDDFGRDTGQCTDAERRSGQVAAHVGEAADCDCQGNKAAEQVSEQRAIRKVIL